MIVKCARALPSSEGGMANTIFPIVQLLSPLLAAKSLQAAFKGCVPWSTFQSWSHKNRNDLGHILLAQGITSKSWRLHFLFQRWLLLSFSFFKVMFPVLLSCAKPDLSTEKLCWKCLGGGLKPSKSPLFSLRHKVKLNKAKLITRTLLQ